MNPKERTVSVQVQDQRYGWIAFVEDWDLGDPIESGYSKQEALDNLQERLEDLYYPDTVVLVVTKEY